MLNCSRILAVLGAVLHELCKRVKRNRCGSAMLPRLLCGSAMLPRLL